MTAIRVHRVRRWLRRWVANPIASLVLVGVLVGDSLTLPRDWNPTLAGGLVRSLLSPETIYYCFQPDLMYVVRDPSGMRVIDEDSESWDELSGLMDGEGAPVAVCDLVANTSRHGVWSYLWETEHWGVRVNPMVGDWTAAELAQARASLFGEQTRTLPCWGRLAQFEPVAEADSTRTRVLWSGVAHDLFAITVFALLLYSFTAWPAWFAARPWAARARRLARGLCPQCGYDTRGLRGGVCPECGHPEPPA